MSDIDIDKIQITVGLRTGGNVKFYGTLCNANFSECSGYITLDQDLVDLVIKKSEDLINK